MRKTILTLSLGALLLSGCDSDHTALTPAVAQAPQTSQEAHAGTIAISGQEYPLHFEFTRQGASLDGVGRVVLSDTRAVVGKLTGSDSGGSHQFTLDLRPSLPLLTFTGQTGAAGFTGTIDADGQSTKTLAQTSVVLDNAVYSSQKATAAPPLAGRYTVTFDDGTVTEFEATQAPVNDPNPPDFQSKNAVLTYVVDQGAADPTYAGGGTYVAGNMFLRLNTFDSNYVPYMLCFLTGTTSSGTYTEFFPDGTPSFQRGKYTMTTGF